MADVHIGDGTTFWPVIEAVHDAAGISPDHGPDIGLNKLATLVVDQAVVERLVSILGLSYHTFSIDELFWAVRRWLETMTERHGPICWVVDDIHWAEPTFLTLLQHVVETAIGHPIFVICSARHELLDRERDWGRMAAGSSLRHWRMQMPARSSPTFSAAVGSQRTSPIAW